MKQLIYIFIFCTFCSCSAKGKEKSQEDKEQNKAIEMEKKQDKRIDGEYISAIMNLSPQEAINRLGQTIQGYMGKDDEFVIDDKLPEFRIELYNIYTPEQYKSREITIKELTWEIEPSQNLTVWYEKDDKGNYSPKKYLQWYKDEEF